MIVQTTSQGRAGLGNVACGITTRESSKFRINFRKYLPQKGHS